MKHLKFYKEYQSEEMNEGWKSWAAAGMIGLTSLVGGQNSFGQTTIDPLDGAAVNQEYHQQSPSMEKESTELISQINSLDKSKIVDNGDGTYQIGDYWIAKSHNNYSNATTITFGSGTPNNAKQMILITKQVDGWQGIYANKKTTGFQVYKNIENAYSTLEYIIM